MNPGMDSKLSAIFIFIVIVTVIALKVWWDKNNRGPDGR